MKKWIVPINAACFPSKNTSSHLAKSKKTETETNKQKTNASIGNNHSKTDRLVRVKLIDDRLQLLAALLEVR